MKEELYGKKISIEKDLDSLQKLEDIVMDRATSMDTSVNAFFDRIFDEVGDLITEKQIEYKRVMGL